MPPHKDTNINQNRRFTDQFKSWLPIVISIGGIIVGYILFKANTEHRLNAAEHSIAQLQSDLRDAREDLIRLDRININVISRIKVLERQPIGDINE